MLQTINILTIALALSGCAAMQQPQPPAHFTAEERSEAIYLCNLEARVYVLQHRYELGPLSESFAANNVVRDSYARVAKY